MSITIPVKIVYTGEGFSKLEKDAARAERAAIASTRRQLAEHRKVAQLTAKLDKDMAKERQANDLPFLGKVALGAAALQAAKFTAESALMADQAVASERSFVNLSGSVAQATENLEAMQRATRDAASEQEQMAIANQLLGMQIVKNDEELEHLVSGARRLGKEFKGMSAREAAEDFALLLSNMSFLRLDQFGLSAGKVRERVNELKASGMEAEEAFKTAVFEEMDKTIARLGPEVGTTAEKFATLSAKAADAQVAFGKLVNESSKVQGFLDASIDFVDAWAEGLDVFRRADDATLSTISRMQTGAVTAQEAGAAIEEINRIRKEQIEVDLTATNTIDDNTAATDANIKAQEELAKALEAANSARRDFAGAMIDIEARAKEDTAAAWDDFYKETQAATKEHNENIIKINAASEKERLANEKQLAKDLADVGKDLAKDLARLDKDLAKDKAKLNKDTDKQIARMQQDAAKEEKQARRARLIDARGDERLFQFDMKQLAAEGSFNAIQEAMERRAIEKEIDAEKLAEEQTAKAESSRIEIDRIRQDKDERMREMEAEAAERKEGLETAAQARRDQLTEQAAEEEIRRQEELAQALADEQTSYDERMDALAQHRDEKLAAIEEAKNEAIAKQMEELVELGILTDEELAALVDKAYARGQEIGAAVAHGMASAYAKEQQISDFLDMPNRFGGGGREAGPSARPTPGRPGRPVGHPGAFAEGGAFTVGGFGGTDSQLVQFMATPGEGVTITPPGQQGGGLVIQQSFTINGPGGAELAAIVSKRTKQAAEAAVEEYHSQVIVPWSQGQ